MLRERVIKGVVLAAGLGSRMRPLTWDLPKVLVTFQGKPLILYPVEAMAHAGIKNIAVVVGYRGETIREVLGDGQQLGVRLEYLNNPYYRGGNALSVLVTEEWLQGQPFVLSMGDHVVQRDMVERLLENRILRETLCVDRNPLYCADVDEATKVRLDHLGFIRGVGKELTSWDVIDTGVFLLTQRFIRVARDLIPEMGMSLEISDVVRHIATSDGTFATYDVTGYFWTDMDTWEDLYVADLRSRDRSLDTTASSPDT